MCIRDRCVGVHLARLQLRVAAEELERCVPGYRLADPDSVSAATIGARDELWIEVPRRSAALPPMDG